MECSDVREELKDWRRFPRLKSLRGAFDWALCASGWAGFWKLLAGEPGVAKLSLRSRLSDEGGC